MLISTAYAQTTGAAGSGAGGFVPLLIQMAALGAVFWFLLIRPQQKRLKEHKARIEAVKKGDQVVTGGGMVGKVVRVDEIYADVEIATGVKVKVVKSTITDIIDGTSAKPAND